MKRLRTAIVGCGKVAHLHAAALHALPESHFAAVCDRDESRARAFALQYGVEPWDDVARMVAGAAVEVVIVCTPHPLHAEPAIAAAGCGAHVLVEKPLAASAEDCARMIAAAKNHHVKLGVVSQRRYLEPVVRMKQAIDAGKIGRPILGTVSMFSWRDEAYYQSDPWRGKWDTEGGGVLINQSPHHIDILEWLMGPVEEVVGRFANLNHPYIEVEDTALALLRFRSGALGSVTVSLCQKPGIATQIHIHGSNGASVGAQTDTGATFIAGMMDAVEPPFTDLWTIPGESESLTEFQRHDRECFPRTGAAEHYHALQDRNFLRAVLDGHEPSVTGEDGRRVVEIITATYESGRTGQPVRLPLHDDER